MSAPGTHPAGDIWPGILDQWRCTGRDSHDRRCQLYRDHTPAHAHAERLPGKRFNSVVHRWDDAGRCWDEPHTRLRWCCMFAA